jgi:hypothetical protein
MANSMSNLSIQNRPVANMNGTNTSFSLPQPRPITNTNNSFSLPPPPAGNYSAFTSTPQAQTQSTFGSFGIAPPPQNKPMPQPQKSGLDAFESLL